MFFYWNDNFSPRARKHAIADSHNKFKIKTKNGVGQSYHHPMIGIENIKYDISRLAWLYEYGYFPKDFTRHKDGDVFNNRIENLEESNRQLVHLHSKTKRINPALELKGVYKCKSGRKFRADIQINNKRIFLGVFDTELEAHQAYLDAKAKYLPKNQELKKNYRKLKNNR